MYLYGCTRVVGMYARTRPLCHGHGVTRPCGMKPHALGFTNNHNYDGWLTLCGGEASYPSTQPRKIITCREDDRIHHPIIFTRYMFVLLSDLQASLFDAYLSNPTAHISDLYSTHKSAQHIFGYPQRKYFKNIASTIAYFNN